ncbi:ABC transporter ATP-binding protein [Leadbettera azotonutricia]|uniref:ABC transporter, ATP-binding/permease protein n=1 Tax=Leadbettera azotonutricia (strain ATCC BAA-888 / DSM 13862 / ZAS-9) TaxID=545695 RepID=F5YEI9_LEAAZ|nr:ABC transporter ATP-binding protein [Leadbettera azotonutricia]AEF81118.1 ABC transporter, ATP-binding/permease protein [Leadbettera azotonutricia ZAS-9]
MKRKKFDPQKTAQGQNRYDEDEYLDEKVSLFNIKRCFDYLAKVKNHLTTALLLSVAGNLASLVGPLFIQRALDVAVPNKDYTLLFQMAGLLGVSILVSIALGAVRNVLVAKAGAGIIHDIRSDLFVHLQRLPFAFYDSRPHGKIFVRVVPYVNSVSDALSNGIINFIIEVLNIIFIIFFMYKVSPSLATVTIIGLPVLALFIWTIKPIQRRAWQRVSNKNSNLNAYIQESIDGVKVTQAFDRQDRNMATMEKLTDERNKEWMRAQYISNTTWFSTETISQIVFSFVYIMGAYWMHPMASFGMLLVMGNYAWRFWQPIINLANIYNTFITAMSYLDRIFDTIAEPVKIKDAEGAVEFPFVRGHVEFKDVSFSYDGARKVLNHIDFDGHPGESIAIVGPTGAGKTTIVNLLSRFYNIEEGQVCIDGQDIMKVTLKSLRSQMGIMLQDSFLFTGTIADNIRYGKLDATDEEIRAAAKLIGADSFIDKLPDGYNTRITERGGGISQGERQLLAFTRTLISNPRILILDEATSSIDTGTEQLVQEGIKVLMKGRSSFIIAHRLSTIRDCTRIMVVNEGRIMEIGSHDELMALKGQYYELCRAQYES